MEFQPDPGYVCDLQSCHLVGENAVGLYHGRELILETSGCRINNAYTGSQSTLVKHALKSWLGKEPTKSKSTVFPLICPDPSYYHWMIEYVPKLRLVEMYEEETGSEPTILIEPNARDFVRDTLVCAGYDSDRCEEWDEQSITVDHLVVSAHRQRAFNHQRPHLSNYNPSFKDLDWLRSRMRLNQSESSVGSPKRIYISRQDATRGRKIVNYNDFTSVLERHGIQPYILENYSFSKQLDIFKDAEIIMGPHGAGLLNMIFSPDPTVIELFPKTVVRPYFYFLSSMFGFEYEAIVANNQGSDLIVDTEKLDNLICNVMSGV
jgi:capsular polysaccharide biosynthesis protein